MLPEQEKKTIRALIYFETVRKMKMRQTWMREELIADGVEPLDFVGKFNGKKETKIAEAIRKALGFKKEWAATQSSWENALRFLRKSIEEIGIFGNCQWNSWEQHKKKT